MRRFILPLLCLLTLLAAGLQVEASHTAPQSACEGGEATDLTPKASAYLASSEVSQVGPTRTEYTRKGVKISEARFEITDPDGNVLKAVVTCTGSCSGLSCGLSGCDAWGGGCTSYDCTGSDCTSGSCSKASSISPFN
jgi:hypothetical protein